MSAILKFKKNTVEISKTFIKEKRFGEFDIHGTFRDN